MSKQIKRGSSLKDLSTINGAVAIIPAAGIGQRMNAEVPKQYLKIGERSVLGLTLDRFLQFSPIEVVVLVTSPSDNYYEKLREIENEKIVVIDGGAERSDSVNNALSFLFDCGLPDNTPVMIHDAARPCVTESDIQKLYDHFQETGSACFLAAPVVDTVHQVDDKLNVDGVVDRDCIVKALTPQIAHFIDFKNSLDTAIAKKLPITDDVSSLKASGIEVQAVLGRVDNIKVTRQEDLALAAFYLQQQSE